jgi:hypothetical protein
MSRKGGGELDMLVMGTLEGKRLFERRKGRRDGNLRMDLTEIGSKSVD